MARDAGRRDGATCRSTIGEVGVINFVHPLVVLQGGQVDVQLQNAVHGSPTLFHNALDVFHHFFCVVFDGRALHGSTVICSLARNVNQPVVHHRAVMSRAGLWRGSLRSLSLRQQSGRSPYRRGNRRQIGEESSPLLISSSVHSLLLFISQFHPWWRTTAAMQLISTSDLPGIPATETVQRAGPRFGKYGR